MIRLVAASIALVATLASAAAAPPPPVTVRMSVDEDPFVPVLAGELGCLKQEGLEIVTVRIEDFAPNDYEFQAPMIAGKFDVAYHWFNHSLFGARHGVPVVSVMTINDAPGMKIMVARQQAGAIRTAADFSGKRVAEGAGYGTKALLNNYLARKAGLPPKSYASVLTATAGREAAVRAGLIAGEVDVVTAQEPMIGMLESAGLVSTLYDLNDRASTTKVLGAAWPAHSLLVAPDFIRRNPQTVQRLVNAFTCTMRFVNGATAQQIADRLPASYRKDMTRDARVAWIAAQLPTFARGDYGISPASVRLVADTIAGYGFDDSGSGKWRSTQRVVPRLKQLYDNRFVRKAMRRIPATR